MSQRRRRTKSGGPLARVAHVAPRLLAAFVALVTLLAVLRAGSSYVYCPSMQRVTDGPCCADDRHVEHDEATAAELRSRDCCESHVLGKLPAVGSTASAPHLLAAPVLAVLPAATVVDHRSAPLASARLDHEGRAGPVASARHRAELMVFLS
jgi:hypothetical protein